jgi:putative acetyltransferase
MRSLVALSLFIVSTLAMAQFVAVSADRSVSASSAHPTAVDPEKVGRYQARAKSGAGYFYDDVLEYRVWMDPKDGAAKRNGNSAYFAAFAQYEKALAYSRSTRGAEEPLALIRQLKHINEPAPGVFEVVEGERIAEWKVEWLATSKRVPGAIEKFLADRRK